LYEVIDMAYHTFRGRTGSKRVKGVVGGFAMVVMATVLLAGCSAGSSGPTNVSGATGATGAINASVASNTPGGTSAGLSAGDSSSDHARYCNAIKLSDAQALVKGTLTAVQFDATVTLPADPFDCTFPATSGGGDNLDVTLTKADTFTQSVADQNAGAGTSLTGVGDKAVWVQDATMANPPIVVAIKGSLTCRVLAPPTENTTIEYTAPSGVDQITSAAAATFAQKMAILCKDVFDAAS
jgi:hypothetical protein